MSMENAKRAARYVPLPFTTFGELLSFGLEIHVWCLRCHTMRRPTLPASKLRTCFAGKRFRCRCSAPGYPSFRPGPYAFKRKGDTIADLYCPHCLPPWEMRDVCFEQPPWSEVPLRKGQAFSCPGCRRPVLMHVRAAATHWGAIGGHLR
jgi:hypothetical protein